MSLNSVIYRPHRECPPRVGDRRLDKLTLSAGQANYLNDAELAKLQSHPSYPQLEQWGAIAIVRPESEVKGDITKTPETLDSYKLEDAEELVEATRDLSVLEKWQLGESRRKPPRKTVLAAIDRQLNEVRKGMQGV